MLTTWDVQLLSAIYRVNIILKSLKITTNITIVHLRRLIKFFEKFRENGKFIKYLLKQKKNEILGIAVL